MSERAGAQISRKAFTQSLAILLALLVIAGIATRVVAPGHHQRLLVEGREVVDPSSYRMVGLGMSMLATNLGFSAAIMNPLSLGVAQGIAELPLFSGAWLRILIFVAVYAILIFTLIRYAERIERYRGTVGAS